MGRRTRTTLTMGLLAAAGVAPGCTHHIDVKPIRIEPIYVNITLKVDRELEQFFDFEHTAGMAATQPEVPAPPTEPPASPPESPPPTTAPAPAPGGTP